MQQVRRQQQDKLDKNRSVPVHAVLGTALLSLLPASIDRFSVTSVVIVVVVTACLTGSSLVVALHFNAVGPRRARRCGTWIGQHRSVFQVQGLLSGKCAPIGQTTHSQSSHMMIVSCICNKLEEKKRERLT